MMNARNHWDDVYNRRALTDVSWYEPFPATSMEFIKASGIGTDEPIIDVGGGASFLVDTLLQKGFKDVTVVDISSSVLDQVRQRLGKRHTDVRLIQADVTAFNSDRRYALWHDRAVFHFLTSLEDQARYLRVLDSAVTPTGQLIMATFGPDGPERCSGLPVVRYDAASLAAVLGSGWRLQKAAIGQHRTPSGASQQFLYSLFRRD